jgi:hypothetical protein
MNQPFGKIFFTKLPGFRKDLDNQPQLPSHQDRKRSEEAAYRLMVVCCDIIRSPDPDQQKPKGLEAGGIRGSTDVDVRDLQRFPDASKKLTGDENHEETITDPTDHNNGSIGPY